MADPWTWPTEADKQRLAQTIRRPNWTLWTSRYERYRLLGSRRSVLAVYNSEREKAGQGAAKSVPRGWDRYTAEWPSRAALWDDHVRREAAQRDEAQRQQERDEARLIRRKLLGAGQSLLAQALKLAGADLKTHAPEKYDQKVFRLVSAIERFQKMSLIEYGEPTERMDLHIRDWRDDAIELIQAGKLSFDAMTEVYGLDLATQLFRQAGVAVASTIDADET